MSHNVMEEGHWCPWHGEQLDVLRVQEGPSNEEGAFMDALRGGIVFLVTKGCKHCGGEHIEQEHWSNEHDFCWCEK